MSRNKHLFQNLWERNIFLLKSETFYSSLPPCPTIIVAAVSDCHQPQVSCAVWLPFNDFCTQLLILLFELRFLMGHKAKILSKKNGWAVCAHGHVAVNVTCVLPINQIIVFPSAKSARDLFESANILLSFFDSILVSNKKAKHFLAFLRKV